MIKYNKTASLAIASILILFIAGCKPKAEKIAFGKDQCAECKMTIMDSKFGGEIVTKKGKVYKFDDAHCVAIFLERRGVELNNIHQTLFLDYNDGEFVKVRAAALPPIGLFNWLLTTNSAALTFTNSPSL